MFTLVVLGHLVMGWFLARVMRPPEFVPDVAAVDESVMYLEFLPPTSPVEPAAEAEPDPLEPEPLSPPPSRPPPAAARREAPAMQAIIPSPAAEPIVASDEPRELVAPERDPFHQPSTPVRDRFGRPPTAAAGNPSLPRVAGERPLDVPIPELPAHEPLGPRRIIDVAAAFIGAGRNAPIEAPCGGRINSNQVYNGAFSPNWQRDHGCGDEKQNAGFTGKVELPPGTAR